MISKGMGKGSGVRVLASGPGWVEVIVLDGRYAGREWTLNPDQMTTPETDA